MKKLKLVWIADKEQDLRSLLDLMFNVNANTHDYLMTVNNLSVGLNMPPALKSVGSGDNEVAHSLPPYRPRRAFLVDEYPACPENWMRSSGRTKSYFVPILEDHGLWLDFNACARHTNNVGIVISVQGVNAITGLPCKDAALEQYMDKCPKHGDPFGPDRHCKKCNFNWPRQNYLPSSTTSEGMLWLDGFRAEDGKVRQYVFTAQAMRGVANAIIGKERVFALGISFFLTKQPKPPRPEPQVRAFYCASAPSASLGSKSLLSYSGGEDMEVSCSVDMMSMEKSYTASVEHTKGITTRGPTKGGRLMSAGGLMSASVPLRSVAVKQLEIAAGARINQRVADDTLSLDDYQKEPDGLIVINYCTEEDAKKIIDAGKVDVKGSPEGFLQKVPTGNP